MKLPACRVTMASAAKPIDDIIVRV